MSPGWGSSVQNVSRHVLHYMVLSCRNQRGKVYGLIRPVIRIYHVLGIEAILPLPTRPQYIRIPARALHPFPSDQLDSTYLPLATSHGNVDETASVL